MKGHHFAVAFGVLLPLFTTSARAAIIGFTGLARSQAAEYAAGSPLPVPPEFTQTANGAS